MGPVLSQPRAYHSVVQLSDSSALIMGGWRNAAFGTPTSTCDIVAATSTGIHVLPAASMAQTRAEFPAYKLGDTAVIVFGGVSGSSSVLKGVELYNIQTNTWRTVGQLIEGRRQHVAYPIGENKFLIVGGRRRDLETLSSAEIFDVATGQSVRISDYPEPINGSIGTVTSTGVGVVFGGRPGGPNSEPRSNLVRTHNALTDSWDAVGTLSDGREAPMSTKLRDGRVVIVGGAFREENPLVISREVIVESAGIFKLITDKVEGRLYCAVTEYKDGQIVVAGGQNLTSKPISSVEFVNATTGEVTSGPRLNVPRYRTRGLSLSYQGSKTGYARTALVIGGVGTDGNALSSIEYLDGECTGASDYDLLSQTSMLTLTGSATIDQSGKVELTGPVAYSSGGIWYRGKLALDAGLSTQFAFRLSSGDDGDQPDGGPQGADGVALVIQNTAFGPVGEAGEGIGYEGIPNAIAVEFDSYLNAAYSDPTGSHVAIQVANKAAIKPWHRAPYMLGITSDILPLKSDGTIYYAKVNFGSTSIEVYLDTIPTFATPILTIASKSIGELITLDGSSAAWIGLTSATGFSVQRHELLSWSVDACQPAVTGADVHEFDSRQTDMVVQPMPSADRAQLRWPLAATESNIRVYNTAGQCVWSSLADASELVSGVDLPATDLPAGPYVVQVISGSTAVAIHWIIQR